MFLSPTDDTIIALATPPGVSALGIIRLSGKNAIELTQAVFKGKNLEQQPSHTVHLGTIGDGRAIDEVMVSLFKEPNSFTKENSVEISCHGSPVIIKEIIKLFLKRGVRLAEPGEFTKRAFLNGRFDLAQAEAVADLIHAETDNARQAALNQMRGGFSKEIQKLREELIHFASLIELELDFGEEDVEFAKRDDLKKLILQIQSYLTSLIQSFDQGNVIKNGIPTVIAGKPNAGKSTLLNALLNEEKAIVSEIPGTTRDVIEDEMIVGGIAFRFMDTAGLRETTDVVESIGVERTRDRMKKASLILYLFDLAITTLEEIQTEEVELKKLGIPYLKIGNKMDKASMAFIELLKEEDFLFISAATKTNISTLKEKIVSQFQIKEIKQGDVVVTNLRHYQNLVQTHLSLERVLAGMEEGTTGDFLAMDIRQALHYLGEITGTITSDDLLANIFGKFCIGK
ncbi:MAG: tRNA uridine-5-carboxymethylaminomethyl(34) synthesis GTPase MnmE [Cytophagales bacterium]|nr:tRNA uridine-5-carboxymethylaminomethyl(34) synthesis GTPase MnmE [Cytophagales bacterium]MCA6366336.1 tRNA uridine-5-carboxymethylaminomethyl(34) synthesis GTPase MnmE [Cytophagales bacterium]MCA6371135.1 tRNA uridine-5-carboxymethylaminomethyl(34) synthesis GTPase MnmE [Cytophagales bacterium]MCA6374740.1 tRNA uridine-5-carboxymethylaminomethyl(34) synthesis GTPase MnmE [Cytophagales bacterium]MCA6384609.1 tRNA uridine-5-carboxymethylaminomethyl(34) synthesis GTPase MnmE [Cytophagales bact